MHLEIILSITRKHAYYVDVLLKLVRLFIWLHVAKLALSPLQNLAFSKKKCQIIVPQSQSGNRTSFAKI